MPKVLYCNVEIIFWSCKIIMVILRIIKHHLTSLISDIKEANHFRIFPNTYMPLQAVLLKS